jgi:6-pyruvoyltetrahydropterin/6-carboxytetrahydropterin synthase
VRQWIDDNLDHNLLLHEDDPLLAVLIEQQERVFVMDHHPTAENIAKLIFDRAACFGLPVVEVVLWETSSCHASFSDAAASSKVSSQTRIAPRFVAEDA